MKRVILFSLVVVCSLALVACKETLSEKKSESPYLGKWYVVGKDSKAIEMMITAKTITIGTTTYTYTETGHGALVDGRPFYTIQYGDDKKEYTILFLEEDKTVAVMMEPYDLATSATKGDFLYAMQRKGQPELHSFFTKYNFDYNLKYTVPSN